MNAESLLTLLAEKDIRLLLTEKGTLKVSAPPGALSAEIKQLLRDNKPVLLEHLQQADQLPAADRTKPLPLTPRQQHIYTLASQFPDATFYNMDVTLRLYGHVDEDKLAAAVHAVTMRHESLRTVFRLDGAHILPTGNQLQAVCVDDLEKTIQQIISLPFDIAHDPLFRVTLLRVTPAENVLVLLAHHLVMDARAFELVLTDLSQAYQGTLDETLAPQHAEYVLWQADWSQTPEAEQQRAFWRTQLSDGVPTLALPSSSSLAADQQTHTIVGDLHTRLLAHNQPLFSTLLSAFALVLHGYTEQPSFAVVVPVDNRPKPILESIVGYFNNVVPLPINTATAPTLAALVDSIQATSLAALDHGNIPYTELQAMHPTLFRCMFSLGNLDTLRIDLPGVVSEPLTLFPGGANADLHVSAEPAATHLDIHFLSRHGAFTPDAIQQLAAAFEQTLNAIITTPQLAIADALPKLGFTASQSARFAAPTTSTERSLHDIWCDLFKLDQIGVHSSFFALGGQSLLALELFTHIEQTFGRNLPLATLFTADTIATLANEIDAGDTNKTWSSIVSIQPYGEQAPFFCIHGLTGDILWFRELGQLMAPDLPFYGIQSVGLDGEQTPLTTIEEMAAHYIEQMKIVQPSGPYRFGGASFGGTVAVEMARQLAAAGDSAELVVLFDHVPDVGQSVPTTQRAQAFVTNLPAWANATRQLGYERIRLRAARKARVMVDKVRPKTSTASTDLIDYADQLPAHRQHIIEQNYAALTQHQPQPYGGQALLFRAQARPLGDPIGPEHLAQAALSNVTIVTIPGSHEGIFKSPNVEQMAAALRQQLTP